MQKIYLVLICCTLQIRRQSITSLGVVCKGKPSLVPKVADILAQLLQMDDAVEVNCVNSALVALLRVHAKGGCTLLLWTNPLPPELQHGVSLLVP